ncbi:glutathione S-transferase-like [Pollicipes pollicipes]|uniref:glutathione S-transferase-like n=1 Tax=Pollicipes pollicipes TaxID=41117 RepID=UPI0018850DD2|nr:glutathione S-transferase-like [Pollicipes pollicipes]XP_037084208.1 glutathione S-transferase-like [Pollicipes pollicipes]XP_037084233.1 glutathione S-transferase-like [Pollicipes pollicipes]
MGSVVGRASKEGRVAKEQNPTPKMPALKLIYFDGKGRAEPLRWILAAGNVPFEQETFGFDAWPARKPNTPYGSVPILMVDGQPLCQTLAIARYAGTLGGLVSKDALKNALGDEAADTMAEVVSKFFDTVFEKDAEKKASTEKSLFEEYLPKVLNVWESRMSGAFLADDKAMWQDVFVGHWLSRLEEARPDLLAKFPKLAGQKNKVLALDGIKKYLASPPQYSLPL